MTNVYQSKWSGLPESEADLVPVAAPSSGKRWTRKRKMTVAGIAVAGVLVPTAAWAAITLFGFGSIDAAAATTQNLTIDNATVQLVGSLVPGQTVGAKANVHNPNDFPVTVTGVLVQDSSVAVNPNTADCQTTVHLIGTPGATYPGTGGGTATKQAIAANVVIGPNETKTVTVPQAVKQDASATTICGVKANFAVQAQTAS